MQRARSQAGLSCCLLLALAATAASGAPELRFTDAEELRGAGLRMRMLRHGVEQPLTTPTAITYKNMATGETIDKFRARDMWRRTQHLAAWTDRDGNALRLATVGAQAPEGPAGLELTLQQLDTLQQNERTVWNGPALEAWLSAYLGRRELPEPTKQRGTMRITHLLEYADLESTPPRLAYLYRFRNEQVWQLAAFSLGAGVDAERAQKRIVSDFFGSLVRMRLGRSNGRTTPSKFQDRSLMPGTKDGSPEREQSRRLVLESIRNLKDWWHVETPDYVILSNLGTRDRIFIKRMQTDLGVLRDAYERIVPPKTPIDAVSVVRVFADAAAYQAYVPRQVEWTGGVWMPSKKELVIKPVDWGRSSEQRDLQLSVLYHEAFHQYLFYAYDMTEASMWYNEGHADLFGAAHVRGKRVTFGESAYRIEPLLKHLRNAPNYLPRLVELSHSEFYGDSDSIREVHYSLAWGLIYYLRKGAPLKPGNRYARILPTYEKVLWETRDHEAATAAAFKNIDFDQLDADFRAFWTSSSSRGRARRATLR